MIELGPVQSSNQAIVSSKAPMNTMRRIGDAQESLGTQFAEHKCNSVGDAAVPPLRMLLGRWCPNSLGIESCRGSHVSGDMR